MNSLRDSLVVITTIATILGFYLKMFNNFFIKVIKREYENVPGNQTMFDMTLKYLAYTGVFVYITAMFLLLSRPTSNNSSFDSIKNWNWFTWIFVILIFSAIIGAIVLLTNIIQTTFYNFEKLKNIFCERMKGSINIPSDKMKMESKVNSILLGAMVVVVGVPMINEIINCFELVNLNKETNKSIMIIIAFVGVELFFSAMLIVSLNLLRVIDEFIGNYTYIILTEAEEIKCKCYIEFNENYLIIENDIERYLNKSKVKEIKKILKIRKIEKDIKYSWKQFFKNIFFTICFNSAFNKKKRDT